MLQQNVSYDDLPPLRADDFDQFDLERQVFAGERVIAVHGDAGVGDRRDADADDPALIVVELELMAHHRIQSHGQKPTASRLAGTVATRHYVICGTMLGARHHG